ncbi:hypothetical protein DTL70_23835 [Streptomyces diacarni]|uniref:FUSC family protein n=1 Tax=Streptomyces diacarni TaxID=2800381 RepID=A0A367ERE1_9ACTN|nr:hypothetical protein DTL70_23835 [Streptomyces diacarni]
MLFLWSALARRTATAPARAPAGFHVRNAPHVEPGIGTVHRSTRAGSAPRGGDLVRPVDHFARPVDHLARTRKEPVQVSTKDSGWRPTVVARVRRAAHRARQQAGPERETALLLAKSGAAGVLAWALGAYVIASPQPTYAPFTALLVVQSTAYRSLMQSLRYVVAVVLGVLAAGLVGPLIGENTLAFAAMLSVRPLAPPGQPGHPGLDRRRLRLPRALGHPPPDAVGDHPDGAAGRGHRHRRRHAGLPPAALPHRRTGHRGDQPGHPAPVERHGRRPQEGAAQRGDGGGLAAPRTPVGRHARRGARGRRDGRGERRLQPA